MEGNNDIFLAGDDAPGFLTGLIHKQIFNDIYLGPPI